MLQTCLWVYWYRKFNLDIVLNTIRQECPSKRARACRVKLRDYQFVWSAPSGSNWMIIRFVLSKVNNGRNKRIYALGLRPFEPFDDFAPTLSYQIDKVCSKSIRSTCSLLWSWNFYLTMWTQAAWIQDVFFSVSIALILETSDVPQIVFKQKSLL